MLVDGGARADEKEGNGLTALEMAMNTANEEIQHLLKEVRCYFSHRFSSF